MRPQPGAREAGVEPEAPADQVSTRPAEIHEGFIAVGLVIRPWGVHGRLRVRPLTDVEARFQPGSRLYLAGDPIEVRSSQRSRGDVVLKLAGIDSIEEADRYRGQYLEIPEHEAAPLPEGSYYRWHLEGLAVVTDGGRALGTVARILETGANDVLIVPHPGGEYLIPLVEEMVTVDLSAGRITVHPIPGLLDEPAEES